MLGRGERCDRSTYHARYEVMDSDVHDRSTRRTVTTGSMMRLLNKSTSEIHDDMTTVIASEAVSDLPSTRQAGQTLSPTLRFRTLPR